jgi:hypothetical protein
MSWGRKGTAALPSGKQGVIPLPAEPWVGLWTYLMYLNFSGFLHRQVNTWQWKRVEKCVHVVPGCQVCWAACGYGVRPGGPTSREACAVCVLTCHAMLSVAAALLGARVPAAALYFAAALFSVRVFVGVTVVSALDAVLVWLACACAGRGVSSTLHNAHGRHCLSVCGPFASLTVCEPGAGQEQSPLFWSVSRPGYVRSACWRPTELLLLSLAGSSCSTSLSCCRCRHTSPVPQIKPHTRYQGSFFGWVGSVSS